MIQYENNSMKVKAAITAAVSQFLTEAGGEIQAQTIRNSRTDTGQTKGSYKYKVVEDSTSGTVFVGSDLQNAIWEEFGTGEYATMGGRKGGYWVFVKGSSGTKRSSKTYTLKEAKKVVAILRAKGIPASYTCGKRPNKPLTNAYNSKKGLLQRRLNQVLKSKL